MIILCWFDLLQFTLLSLMLGASHTLVRPSGSGCGSPYFMDDEVRSRGEVSYPNHTVGKWQRVCKSGPLALSPGFVPELHVSYQLSSLFWKLPGLCVVQSRVQTLKELGKALEDLAPPLFCFLQACSSHMNELRPASCPENMLISLLCPVSVGCS